MNSIEEMIDTLGNNFMSLRIFKNHNKKIWVVEVAFGKFNYRHDTLKGAFLEAIKDMKNIPKEKLLS